MRSSTSIVLTGLVCGLLHPLRPASADDVDITTSFSDFTAQTFVHEDATPFKGYANVTVTNTGTESWGDFHFEIVDVGWDVSNVDFVVDPPYEPTSTQSPLSWVVDNEAYGATLDLFFFSDPVLPGETASFAVYTDNTTDQVPFFGLLIYPTPVPEPAAILLLALGGLLPRRSRR